MVWGYHTQPLGAAVVSPLERNMFSLAELHSHVTGTFSAVRSNAGVAAPPGIRLTLPKLHPGKGQNEVNVALSCTVDNSVGYTIC